MSSYLQLANSLHLELVDPAGVAGCERHHKELFLMSASRGFSLSELSDESRKTFISKEAESDLAYLILLLDST